MQREIVVVQWMQNKGLSIPGRCDHVVFVEASRSFSLAAILVEHWLGCTRRGDFFPTNHRRLVIPTSHYTRPSCSTIALVFCSSLAASTSLGNSTNEAPSSYIKVCTNHYPNPAFTFSSSLLNSSI